MKRLSVSLAAAALAALTACNKTPVQISYPQNPATYCAGAAIAPDKPMVTGTVASYAVSPSLPAGLALNPTDGSISGTPTAAAPATNYSVSALGSDGKSLATASLSLAVGGKISFASPLVYHQDTAVSTFPTTAGATFTDCAVTPALPSGLTLDKTSCAISGTPTAAAAAMDYKVTATGACTSDGVIVNIAVLASEAPAVAKRHPRIRPSRIRRAMAPKHEASRFSK